MCLFAEQGRGLLLGDIHTRGQQHKLLKVAPVERKVRHLLLTYKVCDRRGCGLHLCGLGGYRHCLGLLANFQGKIHHAVAANGQEYPFAKFARKSDFGSLGFIFAWLQIGCRKPARGIRLNRSSGGGSGIAKLDVGIRDYSSRTVGYRSCYCRRAGLRHSILNDPKGQKSGHGRNDTLPNQTPEFHGVTPSKVKSVLLKLRMYFIRSFTEGHEEFPKKS